MTLLLGLQACGPRAGEPGPKESVEAGETGDTATTGVPDLCSEVEPGWVRFEAGTFAVGSPSHELGRRDNETAHEVTLTRAFLVATTEVTWHEYVGRTGYDPGNAYNCGDGCPARNVDWHDSAAYTNAVSDAEGLERCYTCTGASPELTCEPALSPYDCDGYRLLTEAEWERAARAGVDGAFFTGGDLPEGSEETCDAEVTLTDGTLLSAIGSYCLNSDMTVQDVAGLAPNPCGLHDVVGNVYEWVHDAYAAFDESAATDPAGGEDDTLRVHKGGSWGSPPQNARHAYRSGTATDFYTGGLGLRLGRTAP